MKKITMFLMLLSQAIFAQSPPTGAAPTPPARNAVDVISLFTQTTDGSTTVYDDIAVSNFNPNWGSTSGNVTIDAYGGDRALTYPNFDYQGTEIGSSINVSGMETLHMDIWTNNISPNIYLISASTGEKLVNVTASLGSWTSVEIPLTSYSNQGLSLNDIFQIKIATDSGPSGESLYIDNIYFSKPAADPAEDASLSDLTVDGVTVEGFVSTTTSYTVELPSGTTIVPTVDGTTNNGSASKVVTQATGIPGDATIEVTATNGVTTETYTVSFIILGPSTAAPTPPARAASDVLSIFSDAYTNVATLDYDNSNGAINTYNTNWCPGNTELVMIEGNATNKVTGLGCEGVDFQAGRFDASTFTHFHIDIYTDTATLDKSFNMILSQWGGTSGQVSTQEYSLTNASSPVSLPNPNPGTWISLDIPLADFSGSVRDDIVQFVIASDLGTVYYDNLYLYKGSALSSEDFAKSNFTTYPNPTNDSWIVKTSNLEITNIRVFDVLGKNVISMSPNAFEANIDGSSLRTGLYFAQIETPSGIGTIKLVKN